MGISTGFSTVSRFLALYAAVFAGYGRLDAANGLNKGRIQAAMACALIAAISGLMPKMLMTRLRL
jgi:hypothetical protein